MIDSRFGHYEITSNPEASPDGRYLAYGVITFSANAWMLEDF